MNSYPKSAISRSNPLPFGSPAPTKEMSFPYLASSPTQLLFPTLVQYLHKKEQFPPPTFLPISTHSYSQHSDSSVSFPWFAIPPKMYLPLRKMLWLSPKSIHPFLLPHYGIKKIGTGNTVQHLCPCLCPCWRAMPKSTLEHYFFPF